MSSYIKLGPSQSHPSSVWVVIAKGTFSLTVSGKPVPTGAPSSVSSLAYFIDPTTDAILAAIVPAPKGLSA